ncbi:hypothetical protein D3C85_1330530 [compost metagenome]
MGAVEDRRAIDQGREQRPEHTADLAMKTQPGGQQHARERQHQAEQFQRTGSLAQIEDRQDSDKSREGKRQDHRQAHRGGVAGGVVAERGQAIADPQQQVLPSQPPAGQGDPAQMQKQ